MIDENAAHHAGGDAEKLRPVLPRGSILAGHPQVRLMYERRRLKRMTRPFASQVGRRPFSQLGVHEGHEAVGSLRVSLAPRPQKPGDTGLVHLS
jgi:hypothetical protein